MVQSSYIAVSTIIETKLQMKHIPPWRKTHICEKIWWEYYIEELDVARHVIYNFIEIPKATLKVIHFKKQKFNCIWRRE